MVGRVGEEKAHGEKALPVWVRLQAKTLIYLQRSLMRPALDDIKKKTLKQHDASLWVCPGLQEPGLPEEEFTYPPGKTKDSIEADQSS